MTVAPWPYPLWIAHRGAGHLAPENTLAAFRLGAARGYRAFECDVKLSADGVPFLLHDATLERTTSGRGRAADRLWAELSQLDAGSWHSRAYAGEPPASLAAVGAWCRRNGFALDLEIKPTPGQAEATGREVAHNVAQAWAGAPVPPLLTSFDPAALAAARAEQPALPRGLLLDRLAAGWLEQARSLGCVAVVFAYDCIDAQVMAQMRATGLHAMAYTVNDPAEVQRLLALGVEGLVTDAVDRFSPAGALLD